MYSSATDALQSLLAGEECSGGKCRITSLSPREVYLENGLRYFAIEVTRKDGTQYGISAFDEEAKELNRAALRLLSKEEHGKPMAPTLVMASST